MRKLDYFLSDFSKDLGFWTELLSLHSSKEVSLAFRNILTLIHSAYPKENDKLMLGFLTNNDVDASEEFSYLLYQSVAD